jgi:uncharacterized protein
MMLSLAKQIHALILFSTAVLACIFGKNFHTEMSLIKPLGAPSLLICAVQGPGQRSPFAGQTIKTQGLVYADLDQSSWRGFFMQHSDCDGESGTSDGIFVYLGAKVDLVNAGDWVEVEGIVEEYFGRTEIVSSNGGVTVLTSGNPIPDPSEISLPDGLPSAQAYYESLEGMHVSLSVATVVGPTNAAGETWIVPGWLNIGRVFPGDPFSQGGILSAESGENTIVSPPFRVSDRLVNLRGFLDYRLGTFRWHYLTQPTLLPENSYVDVCDPFEGLTAATFNLEKLYDTLDDPTIDEPVLSQSDYLRKISKLAQTIHAGMGEPVLIGVQEAENYAVLADLIGRQEIAAEYGIAWLESPDPRGLEVGLLYRKDVVRMISAQAGQGCTLLIDGLGPDGNGDVARPQNDITCDVDGDGILDGNRLFSRPPLIVRLNYSPQGEVWPELIVIVNHWKSKVEDTETTAYTLPRRLEQARYLAQLSRSIMDQDPQAYLIMMGDLNDHPDSAAVTTLRGAGLQVLLPFQASDQHYTYNYRGISQVLDYILASPDLARQAVDIRAVHINADFPAVYANQSASFYRSSDHDPVVTRFLRLERMIFLPVIFTRP